MSDGMAVPAAVALLVLAIAVAALVFFFEPATPFSSKSKPSDPLLDELRTKQTHVEFVLRAGETIGVNVKYVDGGLVVTTVAGDGAADRAGVRVGHCLSSIDGASVERMNKDTIRDNLKQKDVARTLRFSFNIQ
jgi:C-terminal processing protease CtpA/Prc